LQQWEQNLYCKFAATADQMHFPILLAEFATEKKELEARA